MIFSYCLNPSCPQPKNEPNTQVCQNCGASLILHNRYRAIKKIGKGEFRATFLAIDLSLPDNPFCVIKQLRTSVDNPEAFQISLELFEREAKTLAKIAHPQIPKLLDYFEESHQFYLVQSLVKGRNLQQEIKQNGIFSEIAAQRFLAEILPVLQYIHSLKIIHRNIKPAHILRREQDGRLILIGFGVAKERVNTQLIKTYGQAALTQFSVGTLGYAPPEQLSMRPVYASDLYALGATCLYLLTGKCPQDLCDNVTGELLWQKETNVSPSFANVIDRMLELDVRKRYQSAEEVIQALNLMPYEQELAGGMSKMTMSIENPVISSEGTDTSVSPHSTISQNLDDTAEKLADAIKRRREKKVELQSSPTNPPEPKPKVQLTADMVLDEYARGNKNFSQENLSEINLAKKTLSLCSFYQSKLIGINFQGANLYGANFYNANLAQANLQKANLRRAELQKANLKNADLKNADLKGANLAQANLASANLKDANLCGADLTHAQVDEQQLKSAKTNRLTIYPNGRRRWW